MSEEEAIAFVENLETLPFINQLREVRKMAFNLEKKNAVLSTSQWVDWCIKNKTIILLGPEGELRKLLDNNAADSEIQAYLDNLK